MVRNEIKRGAIYFADFNPALGSEIQGRRPALVIQNDIGNRYAKTLIVAAITSKGEKKYHFQVKISPEESGLPLDSVIFLDQIRTISTERISSPLIGILSESKMLEVDQALIYSLGLTKYLK